MVSGPRRTGAITASTRLRDHPSPATGDVRDALLGLVRPNCNPDTVRTLNDILQRMQAHQTKKRSMLRRLHLAQLFCGDAGG